jgi:hypothetical protein
MSKVGWLEIELTSEGLDCKAVWTAPDSPPAPMLGLAVPSEQAADSSAVHNRAKDLIGKLRIQIKHKLSGLPESGRTGMQVFC